MTVMFFLRFPVFFFIYMPEGILVGAMSVIAIHGFCSLPDRLYESTGFKAIRSHLLTQKSEVHVGKGIFVHWQKSAVEVKQNVLHSVLFLFAD